MPWILRVNVGTPWIERSSLEVVSLEIFKATPLLG